MIIFALNCKEDPLPIGNLQFSFNELEDNLRKFHSEFLRKKDSARAGKEPFVSIDSPRKKKKPVLNLQSLTNKGLKVCEFLQFSSGKNARLKKFPNFEPRKFDAKKLGFRETSDDASF